MAILGNANILHINRNMQSRGKNSVLYKGSVVFSTTFLFPNSSSGSSVVVVFTYGKSLIIVAFYFAFKMHTPMLVYILSSLKMFCPLTG